MTERSLDNIVFAVQCIAEVAERRGNAQAIALCDELKTQLETVNHGHGSDAALREMIRKLKIVAMNLLSALKFELREVLIPFIEVKGATHEFGVQMFPDYFQWLSGTEKYTPGDLVKILEGDTEKVMIAMEHVRKSEQIESQLRER